MDTTGGSHRCDVLQQPKDPVVLGTYDTAAFILSLRQRDEFSKIHSFGYHCVPHIGVYGSEYTLALPVVLLSLPTVSNCLQKLPPDLLNALDLNDVFVTKKQREDGMATTQDSRLESLEERIDSVFMGQSLSLEQRYRLIAREMAWAALSTAYNRLGMNGRSLPLGLGMNDTGCDHSQTEEEWREEEEEVEEEVEEGAHCGVTIRIEDMLECHEIMQDSLMREMNNVSELPQCSGSSSSSERRTLKPRRDQSHTGLDLGEEEEQGGQHLRMVAKKLVRCAIRMACKQWESFNRRSSIEYLIASTKRIRISDSPTPSPLLEELASPSKAAIPRPVESDDRLDDGPLSSSRSGKKRGRSESHDVFFMKELEKFRETRLGEQKEELNISRPRKAIPKGKASQDGALLQPPPSPHRRRSSSPRASPDISLCVLTSNIGRMSIAEAPVESDCEEDTDDYVIINAVTKSPDLDLTDQAACTAQESHVPLTTRPVERNRESGICADRTTRQKLRVAPNERILLSKMNVSQSSTNCSPALVDRSKQQAVSIPDMDLFIIVHSYPKPGLCQKFLCDNANEVNLMYHCWLYPDVPFDPQVVLTDQVAMGIFSPQGVRPVHLDLVDAGIPFQFLDHRTVCIHNCHFSPENAQLQREDRAEAAALLTFFSAARHRGRRVVAFHAIPSSEAIEERLRACTRRSSTLADLLHNLDQDGAFGNVSMRVGDMISPFL